MASSACFACACVAETRRRNEDGMIPLGIG
jgi:hypothetical protein